MTQLIKLSTLGSQLALVIDAEILKKLNIDADTEIEISMQGGALLLRPVKGAFDEEVDASAERMMNVHADMLRNLAK